MKNLITLVVSVFAVVFVSSMAYSADMSIDMLNKLGKEKMVYSVDVAEIDAGDTITWLPASKGHNVHFIAGPDGWDLPKKSKNNKEVAITFDTPGIYLYQCTPHASMGMIGLVIVGGDTSNKDTIAKVKAMGKSKKKLKALIEQL
jgi:pseudoazurin